jgi:hypothetical protein
MSDVFVIASAQQENAPGEGSAAEAVVQSLLKQSGLPARRVQEIHWLSPAGLPAAIAQPAFPTGVPVFDWPPAEQLDHEILQSAARALQLGDRDLILVGQEWQAPDAALPLACAALLLGSPTAIGRYNLMARGRMALRLSMGAGPQEFLAAAGSVLASRSRVAREAYQRRAETLARALAAGGIDPSSQEAEDEIDLLPVPEEVRWLASSFPFEAEAVQQVFPQARRLIALPPAPPGDFFLLDALLKALANSRTQWGMLLSPAPGGAALASLVEKI